MTDFATWHGTLDELQRLVSAVQHHCARASAALSGARTSVRLWVRPSWPIAAEPAAVLAVGGRATGLARGVLLCATLSERRRTGRAAPATVVVTRAEDSCPGRLEEGISPTSGF
jgi:hypothetical protein